MLITRIGIALSSFAKTSKSEGSAEDLLKWEVWRNPRAGLRLTVP
jgi:hypothetical protein